MPSTLSRLARLLAAALLSLALASTLVGSASAQPAPSPNPGAEGFRSSEQPTIAPAKRTPEQALDACIADVERLEKDAVGVPFLAAAYIAFFVILMVFVIIVRMRQRRLETEMDELRTRLARLQGVD